MSAPLRACGTSSAFRTGPRPRSRARPGAEPAGGVRGGRRERLPDSPRSAGRRAAGRSVTRSGVRDPGPRTAAGIEARAVGEPPARVRAAGRRRPAGVGMLAARLPVPGAFDRARPRPGRGSAVTGASGRPGGGVTIRRRAWYRRDRRAGEPPGRVRVGGRDRRPVRLASGRRASGFGPRASGGVRVRVIRSGYRADRRDVSPIAAVTRRTGAVSGRYARRPVRCGRRPTRALGERSASLRVRRRASGGVRTARPARVRMRVGGRYRGGRRQVPIAGIGGRVREAVTRGARRRPASRVPARGRVRVAARIGGAAGPIRAVDARGSPPVAHGAGSAADGTRAVRESGPRPDVDPASAAARAKARTRARSRR